MRGEILLGVVLMVVEDILEIEPGLERGGDRVDVLDLDCARELDAYFLVCYFLVLVHIFNVCL